MMPHTDEFKKLLRHFSNLYDDGVKAMDLAYREALSNDIPTFRNRESRIKKQHNHGRC